MDQGPNELPDHAPDEETTQTSQWLFTSSWRRRRRAIALFVLVLALVALVVVGLLALSSAFFPQ